MNKLTFITLGERSVGKTTFLVSATEKRACTKRQPATVGVDYIHRKFNYGGKVYTIEFRDTTGSEKYRSITPQFIRGCDGAFLMFDKEHSSMEDLEYWKNFYEDNVDDPEWVLVKTKCDSQNKEERKMDCRRHVKFACEHRKLFFEVSARQYKGVEEALEALVTRVLQKRGQMMTKRESTKPKSMKYKAEQNNRDTNYTTGEESKNVILHLTNNTSNTSDNRGNCRC